VKEKICHRAKKVWQKINSLIEYLFGRRKMDIDETLDKWFEKTFAMYQKNVHLPRGVDLLMMGVLRYSRHCSITTYLLLRQEVKLSTMVLLRVYLELYVKLCWCLQADQNTQKNHKDDVYGKFKQWDYKRLVEHRKLLNKRLTITQDDSRSGICEAIKKVNILIDEYKKQGLKCMPDVSQVFMELPEKFQELHTKLYQRFNQAVHPDMEFIRKMVINTGKSYVCVCDVNEDIQELKLYLLSMSCDVNRMIRDFYGWDSAEMQKEYNLMVKQLNG